MGEVLIGFVAYPDCRRTCAPSVSRRPRRASATGSVASLVSGRQWAVSEPVTAPSHEDPLSPPSLTAVPLLPHAGLGPVADPCVESVIRIMKASGCVMLSGKGKAHAWSSCLVRVVVLAAPCRACACGTPPTLVGGRCCRMDWDAGSGAEEKLRQAALEIARTVRTAGSEGGGLLPLALLGSPLLQVRGCPASAAFSAVSAWFELAVCVDGGIGRVASVWAQGGRGIMRIGAAGAARPAAPTGRRKVRGRVGTGRQRAAPGAGAHGWLLWLLLPCSGRTRRGASSPERRRRRTWGSRCAPSRPCCMGHTASQGRARLTRLRAVAFTAHAPAAGLQEHRPAQRSQRVLARARGGGPRPRQLTNPVLVQGRQRPRVSEWPALVIRRGPRGSVAQAILLLLLLSVLLGDGSGGRGGSTPSRRSPCPACCSPCSRRRRAPSSSTSSPSLCCTGRCRRDRNDTSLLLVWGGGSESRGCWAWQAAACGAAAFGPLRPAACGHGLAARPAGGAEPASARAAGGPAGVQLGPGGAHGAHPPPAHDRRLGPVRPDPRPVQPR